MKLIKQITCIMALSLFFWSCQTEELTQHEEPQSLAIEAFIGHEVDAVSNARGSGLLTITPEYLDGINEVLAAKGMNYRVAAAEYITASGSQEAGNTVLSKIVGNKQLGHDFVPDDARRTWSADDGNTITYAIDTTNDAIPFGGGLSAAETDAAIESATNTWRDVNCSDLGLTRNPDFGLDIGVVAFINGLGGSPFILADVQHGGFREVNYAGGVIGVTHTFVFTDGGVPTDIDNNGKADVAFREINYDPSWIWADDGVANIDVETVALHELGHGLSQGHFGKVMIKNNTALKASPRAVMNALYTGPYAELAGTDNGGHCSNWGEWPNN
jgi:hypothetical protein